jgi:DHA2 family multidrug resistance protein-like MFS transporter
MVKIGARRWWALGAMALAVFAVTLDVTIVNVALPTLAGELRASESHLQWFVTAYTLALVAGMLPAGLLGDRYGRKLLLCSALVLFVAGSLGCAYATGPEMFVVARVALGLAGAVLIVMVLSTITVLFDETERTRAVGIWGAANFIGLPLGPIIGGWILSNVWWGWVFLMNVPVALIGLAAVLALVPESKATDAPDLDVLGVLVSSAGLIALMYGLTEAGDNGWSGVALGWSIAGLVVLALFVLWERWLMASGRLEPLVDLSLFRSRSFTWGVICTSLGVFGLFGVMFALPQYFQAIMGVDAQGSGFRLLPVVCGMIVGLGLAFRLVNRIGPKLSIALGFVVVVAGTMVGTTMTPTSGDLFMAAWSFVVGAGAGLGFAGAMSAALVEIDPERSGVASALLQAIVKLGPAFGATILGSVLNSTYQSHVGVAGLPATAAETARASVFGAIAIARQANSPALLDSARTAFVAGMDDALRVAAAVAVVAIPLALLFLPSRVPAASPAEAPQARPAEATVD